MKKDIFTPWSKRVKTLVTRALDAGIEPEDLIEAFEQQTEVLQRVVKLRNREKGEKA